MQSTQHLLSAPTIWCENKNEKWTTIFWQFSTTRLSDRFVCQQNGGLVKNSFCPIFYLSTVAHCVASIGGPFGDILKSIENLKRMAKGWEKAGSNIHSNRRDCSAARDVPVWWKCCRSGVCAVPWSEVKQVSYNAHWKRSAIIAFKSLPSYHSHGLPDQDSGGVAMLVFVCVCVSVTGVTGDGNINPLSRSSHHTLLALV